MPDLSKKQITLIAAGLFGFALLLRLVGIAWGLKNDLHNQSYHPDEPVIFAYSQNIEPAKLQFTPGFYNYGTLYLTMLRVAGDMTAAYTGAPDPKSDDSFWSFVSRVHLAGRVLSALAGAATAVVLFFIGLRFLGLVGGLAAGLAIAVSSAHTVHSRFQTVDVIAVFFLALGTLFALRLLDSLSPLEDPGLDGAGEMVEPTARGRGEGLQEPNRTRFSAKGEGFRTALLCGVFTGLSAGTKYTGILGLITLFVVAYALVRTRRASQAEAAKLALVGLGSALLTFIITTPGVLLDTDRFMRDFKYEMVHTATGHGLVFAGTSPGFIYHLGNLFSGIGILITLMGIGGLVWAAVRRNWWALALLAFFVPYYVLIGRAEVKFIRYTFPLYIGIAAGFGYVLAETQKTENWRKTGIVLGILTIGGIDFGGLVGAAKSTAWMAGEDPRDSAARYIRDHSQGIPPATVGYAKDPWTWSVPLFKDATLPRMPMGPNYLAAIMDTAKETGGQPGSWQVSFLARMKLLATTTPKTQLFYEGGQYKDFDQGLLQRIKPSYVPLTSLEVGQLASLRQHPPVEGDAANAVRDYAAFMDELERDYTLAAAFGAPAPSVEDMQYVQPQVTVWKRKNP